MTISSAARAQAQTRFGGDEGIVLVTITHPLLDAPLRLASGYNERIQDEPRSYGVRSKALYPQVSAPGIFNLATPAVWDYVLMGVILPEDREAGPSSSDLVIERVASGMLDQARKISSPARIDYALVLPDTPDIVEFAWADQRVVDRSADDATITLTVAREGEAKTSWPFGRMTRNTCPGLDW